MQQAPKMINAPHMTIVQYAWLHTSIQTYSSDPFFFFESES